MLEMSALDLSINTIMSHISHSHVLSRVTKLLTWLKNVAKLRDVQWCHVQSLPSCTVLSQVTLAVPGLSRDSLTHQHPCGRVSQYAVVTLAVLGLSWDYLPSQHPCGRESWNAGVTPAVLRLFRDSLTPPAPLWQSILVSQIALETMLLIIRTVTAMRRSVHRFLC